MGGPRSTGHRSTGLGMLYSPVLAAHSAPAFPASLASSMLSLRAIEAKLKTSSAESLAFIKDNAFVVGLFSI